MSSDEREPFVLRMMPTHVSAEGGALGIVEFRPHPFEIQRIPDRSPRS
jgi:hypothetical protein